MAEEEKLLNVDLNYLLIWLIASDLCSNYTVGKKRDKKVHILGGRVISSSRKNVRRTAA